MITRVKHVTSLTTSMSAMHFLIDIIFSLKEIKYHFKGPYDKQNITRVVTLYEIYETSARRVS